MKVFGYQHNGEIAVVALGNDNSVMVYRCPQRSLSPQDGDISSTDVMHRVVKIARPLIGNVSENLRVALQGAIDVALKDATRFSARG